MKFLFSIVFILCMGFTVHAQSNDSSNTSSDCMIRVDTVTIKEMVTGPIVYVNRPNWDIRLFRSINNGRKPLYDFVVPITDRAIFPAALGVPPLLFLAGRLSDHPYDENSGVISSLSGITATTVTFALKYTLKRERPFAVLDSVYYNDQNSLTDRYSFPSGHTSTAFSLATSLSLRYPDNPVLITGLYAHAVAVGFGRMYLGVHYPSDVIAGAFIGAGSAMLMYSLRKEIVKIKNDVFKEEGVSDQGSSRTNQYLILGAVVLSDLLNYIIYHSDTKFKRHGKVGVTSDGNANYLRFTYNF